MAGVSAKIVIIENPFTDMDINMREITRKDDRSIAEKRNRSPDS